MPVDISLLGLLFIGIYILPGAFGGGSALTSGVVLGVGVVLSILLHELAHATVGMAFGANVIGIQLNLLGGVTYFAAKPATYFRDIVTSLAGPATNIALWKLCELVAHPLMANGLSDPTAPNLAIGSALMSLSYLNLFLGLFNALPLYPLDGGQATYMLARWFTANEKFAAGLVLIMAIGTAGFIFFGQTGLLGGLGSALPVGGIFGLYICVYVLINSFNLYNQATSIARFRPTPRQQAEKMREEVEKKSKTRKAYAIFEQGKALLLERNYTEAIARFNEALELEPGGLEYLDYRAYTYLEMDRSDLALADYDVLLVKQPKRADYYTARANIYRKLNNLPAARWDAEQALKLNPMDNQARKLNDELARL